MRLDRLNAIITNESDANELKSLCSNGVKFNYVFAVPELIQIVGLVKSFTNATFRLFIMVDYPKANRFSVDKFKGTNADFFLSDGYDIHLSINRPIVDIIKEIGLTYNFVKDMIGNNVGVGYTLNCSCRSDDDLEEIMMQINKHPSEFVKLESEFKLPVTKSNTSVINQHINNIRKFSRVPVIISGNVDFSVYRDFSNGVAVSTQQANNIIKENKNSDK